MHAFLEHAYLPGTRKNTLPPLLEQEEVEKVGGATLEALACLLELPLRSGYSYR